MFFIIPPRSYTTLMAVSHEYLVTLQDLDPWSRVTHALSRIVRSFHECSSGKCLGMWWSVPLTQAKDTRIAANN
jgi:hypothetical protein